MKSLIRKLVEITGPSGYESEVRAAIRDEIGALADELRVDALGNLIAVKGPVWSRRDKSGPRPELAPAPGEAKGKSKDEGAVEIPDGGKKIMLSAHMDEIGLMATHIDEKGFVRFTTLGGVARQTCVGGRVRFLNGTPGVIGQEQLEDKSRLPAFEQMFIDVGAGSRAACPVSVGDIAAFDRPWAELGPTESGGADSGERGARLVAKAMDDRIGVAILIETLRQLEKTPHQLCFVFSVQEEVGSRGAATAAFGLDPDIGIAVDVTATGDVPRGLKMEVSLGQGPAIKVRDGGMLSDPAVVSWMVSTAQAENIPHQIEVLESGSTDARAIQLARAGVPSGCLSIPCRYIHTPSEMVDFRDVQNAVRLLKALLSHPAQLG